MCNTNSSQFDRIMNALKDARETSAFDVHEIGVDSESQIADSRRNVIDGKCSQFGDNFFIILAVGATQGFYVIPYKTVKEWFVPAYLTQRGEGNELVWRWQFNHPHTFRIYVRNKPRDMQDYFLDLIQMEEWIRQQGINLNQ